MAVFLQLAPMQAMTDIHFMNTYHRFFGGFTEMMAPYLMASNNSPIKVKNLQKYYTELNPDIKLIPQLLSNDAQGMLHFSTLLSELGFSKINWNLGCPFPFVTKKQRGSGLLPFPERIEEILEQVIPNINAGLSVKLRLGLVDKNEIKAIIPILNKFPLTEVIVHPRTADQKYEGTADLHFFSEIFPLIKHKVIYNGDIIYKEQVAEMEKEFASIYGYMIGRGAFINPFITKQINGINYSHSEGLAKFREFYFVLHQYYKNKSPKQDGFLSHMKELWGYFSQSFNKGESYFFALKSITDIAVFEQTVEHIFKIGQLKFLS
jgi:tRNA-dihydrouridine synthase